jgi:hypothetical protein
MSAADAARPAQTKQRLKQRFILRFTICEKVSNSLASAQPENQAFHWTHLA